MAKKVNIKRIDTKFKGNTKSKLLKKIALNLKKSKYVSGQLCKYIKKEIKDGGKFKLQTPFGVAQITKMAKRENETHVHGGRLSTYKSIGKKLELTMKKVDKIKNLEIIYDFLSIPNAKKIDTIPKFNNEMKKRFKRIKENNALKYLCAILMISEPYRFNDGGGLSRGTIKTMYVEIKNKKSPDGITKVIGGDKKDGSSLMTQKGGKSKVQKAMIKKGNGNEILPSENLSDNED